MKLLDLLQKKHIDEFIEFLIDNYKEDSRLMIWMGDHIFGKAPQPLSNPGGEVLKIAVEISEAVAKKNGIK